MLITKNFRAIRFLNRDHSALVRGFFALSGLCASLLVTGRPRLASHLCMCFWSNDFKAAARLTGWYLRTSWMQWYIAHDPYFNPTDNVPAKVFQAQSAFLNRAQSRLHPEFWHGERLVMSAHAAHAALYQSDMLGFKAALDGFAADADILLNIPSSDLATPPSYRTRENKFLHFPKLATRALADFIAEMDLQELPWFVIGGTFLGAVREKDFLPHDTDIDVGVWASQVDAQTLAQSFRKLEQFTVLKMAMKFEIFRNSEGSNFIVKQPACLKIVHDTGINIDIFMHYPVGQKTLHGSGSLIWENKRFDLASYPLGAHTVQGPADADTYLTEHYGDWRTEQTEYSCVTGTSNIAYVRNLNTISFHIRRYVLAKSTDPNSAEAIENALLQQGIIKQKSGAYSLDKEWFVNTLGTQLSDT